MRKKEILHERISFDDEQIDRTSRYPMCGIVGEKSNGGSNIFVYGKRINRSIEAGE